MPEHSGAALDHISTSTVVIIVRDSETESSFLCQEDVLQCADELVQTGCRLSQQLLIFLRVLVS